MKELGARICAVALFVATAALALGSMPVLVGSDHPLAAADLPEMAAARWSAMSIGAGEDDVPGRNGP